MKSFKYIIFALVFAAGCAHSRSHTLSYLEQFESSGSFCIDAYMVNSGAAGCTNWSTRNVSGIGEIRCLEPVGSENEWISSTFVFFPSSAQPQVPQFQPLCVDSQIVFGKINLQ